MKTFHSNKQGNKKGFTIIETLVAVTIMMVSLAGPLTVAYKSYVAAVLAHSQMTASYLAQDALEYVKNVRDTNLLRSQSWLTGLSGCTSSSRCKVDTLNPSISGCSGTECVLTRTTSGYGHGAGISSAFSRQFFLSSISANEAKATVIVSWNTGVTSNQVQYEAELFSEPK